jgi:hypothetical protein
MGTNRRGGDRWTVLMAPGPTITRLTIARAGHPEEIEPCARLLAARSVVRSIPRFSFLVLWALWMRRWRPDILRLEPGIDCVGDPK